MRTFLVIIAALIMGCASQRPQLAPEQPKTETLEENLSITNDVLGIIIGVAALITFGLGR